MIDSSTVGPDGYSATLKYGGIILLGTLLFTCAAQAGHWQTSHYGNDPLGGALRPHVSEAATQALSPIGDEFNEPVGSAAVLGEHATSLSVNEFEFNINHGIRLSYVPVHERTRPEQAAINTEQSILNWALFDKPDFYGQRQLNYRSVLSHKPCPTRLRCGVVSNGDSYPRLHKQREDEAFARFGLFADQGSRGR